LNGPAVLWFVSPCREFAAFIGVTEIFFDHFHGKYGAKTRDSRCCSVKAGLGTVSRRAVLG